MLALATEATRKIERCLIARLLFDPEMSKARRDWQPDYDFGKLIDSA